MNLRMAVTIPRAIRTVQTLSRHVAPFKWRNYAAISNLQLANDNKSVSVEFDGVGKHVYHAVWLKHLCHCLNCKDPRNRLDSLPNQFEAPINYPVLSTTEKVFKLRGKTTKTPTTRERFPLIG